MIEVSAGEDWDKFVALTIVGVLIANQIQKAIDKARVSTLNP
jgi:hypothetical protein